MEAQLLLMQRLSSQLQAPAGGQADSSGSDEEQWQHIALLWKEVQPPYMTAGMSCIFNCLSGTVGLSETQLSRHPGLACVSKVLLQNAHMVFSYGFI